jgi:hypothetical protein
MANRTRKNRNNMRKNNQMGGASKATGSKREVWNGTARHTSGGLHRKDLMKHKGRIVSKKKHAAGKKAIKNLIRLGYKAKKGTFKLFRKGKKRGGYEDVSGYAMDASGASI